MASKNILKRLINSFLKMACGLIPFKYFRQRILNMLQSEGDNNKIIIIKNGKEYVNNWLKVPRGLNLKVVGSNNIVKIGRPIKFKNTKIKLAANGGLIEIGGGGIFINSKIYAVGKPTCKIGKNTTFGERVNGGVEISMSGKSEITIGEDCMFSWGIIIKTTDSHGIFDKNSGERINKQKTPLVIGEHTWVGQDVSIAKNVHIAPNTIVGMKSVVGGKFAEEYTCIAGNPAKVIKKDVVWSRELV